MIAFISDGAKLRKVCESAKKSGGKFGGNGKNANIHIAKYQKGTS
jgi:hypothetical protein